MSKTYKVCFHVENLGLFGTIPNLQECMQEELIKAYNVYADKSNAGVTEQLNEEFDRLNPGYFKDKQDKEWYELTEYNQFMANGYQQLIVDEMNKSDVSPLLEFFVNPEEVNFMGRLKAKPDVTIDFYLKEE